MTFIESESSRLRISPSVISHFLQCGIYGRVTRTKRGAVSKIVATTRKPNRIVKTKEWVNCEAESSGLCTATVLRRLHKGKFESIRPLYSPGGRLEWIETL